MITRAKIVQATGTAAVVLLSCTVARGEVTVSPLFSDNMVLQRERPVPVWGTAGAGEKITVSIGRQKHRVLADRQGRWRAVLRSMPAARNLSLAVKGGNEVRFSNVAAGDVYICSGQSNMEFPLHAVHGAEQAVLSANFSDLRLFTVPRRISPVPQREVAGATGWQPATPLSANGFSAVAYFFGRHLHRELGVPVGLINVSFSGTYAEAWVSPDTLQRRADRGEGAQPAAAGGATDQLTNPNQPGVLYNGMISPLTSFPIRGVIWYQGESNADKPGVYRTLFPDLIRGWRASWNTGPKWRDFGFYFVQLPNYGPRAPQPVESGWAELREAQSMALKLPRTGMAVTVDVGDAADIHPGNKQDVGRRLALVVLAKEYGRKIEWSGPQLHALHMKPGSREVSISWRHAKGLRTADGQAPRAFAIQGRDGSWYPAQARIEGESVVLSCTESPVAVRYAWANNPDVNLINAAGLPATPFRTDKPE